MARIVGRTSAESPAATTVKQWRECAARMDQPARARSQAATILLDARAQARAILEGARVQAEAEASAIHQHAWDAGHAAGLAQGQHDVAAVMQRLAMLVGQAVVSYEASARHLDEAALALVLAIAAAVVRREVDTAPETVLATVRVALAEMSLEATVQLRVHPDDEDVLRPHLASLGLPSSVDVSVVADASLSRGGCIVESGAGRVDATIETQIARIETALREHLHAA